MRAAASARASDDFLIIARTDSRAVMGFDEAVARCNGALEAGADVALFEAPQTMEEVEKVPQVVKGPCLLNVVHKGKTPKVELEDAKRMGYKIAILPSLIYRNILGATEAILKELATGKMPTPMGDLSPGESRAEAGDDFILSGGVSPDLWLPTTPLETFEAKVLEWLQQKQQTFRFIAGAGDQVPPGAEERRIAVMRDLVEEHGVF